jgi:hypothetical protein
MPCEFRGFRDRLALNFVASSFISIAYRAICALPIAFDKPAVGITYVIALDRHGVRLAGLCYYFQ